MQSILITTLMITIIGLVVGAGLVFTAKKFYVEVDEREAARYGIHAVPFFVIGQYGISGAQSVEGMKAALMKVLEEETGAAPEQGMTCGPEGCHIG